ncbi:MAG: hypothetical protein E2P02_21240 [Acidobacteria bacterium]|nr:MAG: hypothetical protein E2P02_21240 [Acidobacteriota bacterium]
MAQIEELQEKYSDIANFVIVYIKEAHPDDEWQMESNEESGVIYSQPKSTEERRELARAFIDQMDVQTETLLDDIDNTAMACYAAWPERLYIIGTDGRIIYKGGMGPFYFDPDEVEEILLKEFAPATD